MGFFDAYQQVTQGLLSADDMIAESLQSFEEAYGLTPKMPETQEFCPAQPTTITIWHSLPFDVAQAITELASQFEETCPGTTLALTYVPNEEIK